MTGRIPDHPIIKQDDGHKVAFFWNGEKMKGVQGEMLSSALIANGVLTFNEHPKDGAPQGIFCANGQCSQCMVLLNGKPVKSCMVPLEEGARVKPVKGLPKLPTDDGDVNTTYLDTDERTVLVIGGGPAGLSACIELGKLGIDVLLVDDKDRLGGKLVLQTHKFFGSVEDSYAGTRGFEIGHILERKVKELDSVNVWLNSTVVAVFADGKVGIVKDDEYRLVRPKKLLVATGAREKMLSFPGNTLPGVYGAGAFQTLVNRDLVKCSERIFIVGGGNVGLIAGYHAIQAGIEVVGLVEALPMVGGYRVHADKLMRLGVPIYTRHTVSSVTGNGKT